MVIISGQDLDSPISTLDIYNFTFEKLENYIDSIAVVSITFQKQHFYSKWIDTETFKNFSYG